MVVGGGLAKEGEENGEERYTQKLREGECSLSLTDAQTCFTAVLEM